MKHLLSLLLLLTVNFSFAQHKLGVYGGINYSGFSEEGFANGGTMNGSELGYKFGILYNFKINNKIHFQPKIEINSIGDKHQENNAPTITFHDLDYSLTYLSFPLIFKFFSKPFIAIGPQFSYLLNTKKLTHDLGEIESNIDYGLNLGIGYQFENLFFEIGIYQGFSTIFKINDSMFSNIGDTNAKNIYLQFNVGYNFF